MGRDRIVEVHGVAAGTADGRRNPTLTAHPQDKRISPLEPGYAALRASEEILPERVRPCTLEGELPKDSFNNDPVPCVRQAAVHRSGSRMCLGVAGCGGRRREEWP